MGDSVFRKIGKILEKPEMPAHLRERQHRVTIPWYESVLDTLRPPSSTTSKRQPMARSQLRILLIFAGIIVAATGGWWIYGYVSTASERSRTAYEAGLKLLGPSDFKGAAEKFSDSISIRETAAAYIERGNAYRNLGQGDKALSDWARAIELDPNSEAAYASRGTHYRITGKNAEAISDFDRSIQLK